jgi:hypothetical protein
VAVEAQFFPQMLVVVVVVEAVVLKSHQELALAVLVHQVKVIQAAPA